MRMLLMTFVAKKRPGQACEPWPNSREEGLFFFFFFVGE